MIQFIAPVAALLAGSLLAALWLLPNQHTPPRPERPSKRRPSTHVLVMRGRFR